VQQLIDILLAAGPTAANLQQQHVAAGRDRQMHSVPVNERLTNRLLDCGSLERLD